MCLKLSQTPAEMESSAMITAFILSEENETEFRDKDATYLSKNFIEFDWREILSQLLRHRVTYHDISSFPSGQGLRNKSY